MATDDVITETFDDCSDPWPVYSERLQRYFVAHNVGDVSQVAVTLGLIGTKTNKLLQELCAPVKPLQKTFCEINSLLNSHFGYCSVDVITQRCHFYLRNQKANESIPKYVADLERLSDTCAFGEKRLEQLRDRFVAGLRSDKVLKRLFAEKALDYKTAVRIATETELALGTCGSMRIGHSKGRPPLYRDGVKRSSSSSKRARTVSAESRATSGDSSAAGAEYDTKLSPALDTPANIDDVMDDSCVS